MSKKVSLAAIRLRAGEIASITYADRKGVTQALIDAHEKLGIEVDFSEASTSTDLNFANGGTKPDFARTQPLKL